ncbi:MAG: hypothetical protein P9M01_04200 [Candidatus Kappaea frigidicola]|nr:hypothetical protein [Candidatus Kappaea frigidicola]
MKIKVKAPLLCYNILKGKNEFNLFILNNALNEQSVSTNVDKDIAKMSKKATDLINVDNKVSLDRMNSSLTINLKAKDATVIRFN